MPDTQPAYTALLQTGELANRAVQAVQMLHSCQLCPRRCGINRLENETGFCRIGRLARVASFGPHFGEEAPLVGVHGSGAIFFAQCNLACVFCQNHEISQHGQDEAEMDATQLAKVMLKLQAQGVHNINLVSPSHVVPQILEALVLAAEQGLAIPLVYNSGGYDALETLALLNGIVDIYMPDTKFFSAQLAEQYCQAPDYPLHARQAIQAIHQQVGDLQINQQGVAWRGLLIRHLVMPAGLAGTAQWLNFLAKEISVDTYINLMDQYRPCAQATSFSELNRSITRQEYEEVLQLAEQNGLSRLDQRSHHVMDTILRALLYKR